MMDLKEQLPLRQIALDLFKEVLQKLDAEKVVDNSVQIQNTNLIISNELIDLSDFKKIYVISLGKAGMSMAVGLNQILSEKISAGIVSAPKSKNILPENWQVFNGGHPFPNHSSLEAAKASIKLLKQANRQNSLVIFLISGGGSAMMELPVDSKISLEDLRQTNELLVKCGATINEVNKFRRTISQIKGGGLSRIIPKARKISLIISDTNIGDQASVASGPTIQPYESGNLVIEAQRLAKKFNFINLLPKSIIDFFNKDKNEISKNFEPIINHSVYTLLDNRIAVESIASSVQRQGFVTEIAADLVENPIKEGCSELVKRLYDLKTKYKEKKVAIISGGEFTCPVNGKGIGGRNSETTLRCLLEIEKQIGNEFGFAILSGGTDGIDGNSPAAGAIADQTTLKRAKELKLKPDQFLENSDSYNFFSELAEVIVTRPTGTNVRDVRILLAG